MRALGQVETLDELITDRIGQLWSDRGQGDFALHFIRDKERREVDFVVVRDGGPWSGDARSAGPGSDRPAFRDDPHC